jgi:hypothetical protein
MLSFATRDLHFLLLLLLFYVVIPKRAAPVEGAQKDVQRVEGSLLDFSFCAVILSAAKNPSSLLLLAQICG